MSYSQNKEEAIISGFFGSFKGSLLSLGENDGVTLSNCRALIERGWCADLVEPSPVAFGKLHMLYAGSETVWTHNVAIGISNGRAPFFDSGTLLKKGDESLVSTLSPAETKRWAGAVEFQEIEVDMITVKELLKTTINKKFDFISIDCEGFDLDILKQINFPALRTRLICVEFNGLNEQAYWDVVHPFGFQLIHKNGENLIYALLR